jgi:hypothetical protein
MTDQALAKWVKSLPSSDGSGPIIAGGDAPQPGRSAARSLRSRSDVHNVSGFRS